MATTKELFKLAGFTVRQDSKYVLKDKRDMDAPSGYIQVGVTKLPSKGVSESFQVKWISSDASGKHGVWDTGFDAYSPCYKDIDRAEAEAIATGLVKNLLEPYRVATGNPTAFEKTPGDHSFFDGLNFKIYSGKTYNTSDPKDAMEVYFGLLSGQMTPKGQEGNTKYNDSSYVLVDIDMDHKVNDERAINKFKAIGSFTGMLMSDKELLFSILTYLGINVTKNIDDTTLIGMFNSKLDSTIDDIATSFNKQVEDAKTKAGREKLVIYSILREKLNKGKLEKVSGIYFYDDMEIGADLKNAAEAITKNSKLVNVKKQLLINED
jgi:hypothetical protein